MLHHQNLLGKGGAFHNCFLWLAHHYSPGLKKVIQMKERKNVFFFLYGWILLLASLCKNTFKFTCENKLWVWTPVFEEIEGRFAWSFRIILTLKICLSSVKLYNDSYASCMHDLIDLLSSFSQYLRSRATEGVPKLYFLFPYFSTRVNAQFLQILRKFWSCRPLELHPRSVWKSRPRTQK